MFSRNWCSEAEDAWYCHPCCHSPGSALETTGSRAPSLRAAPPSPVQLGCCVLQLAQAPRGNLFVGHSSDDVSNLGQPIGDHQQSIRPRRPERRGRHPFGRSEAQSTHSHGQRRQCVPIDLCLVAKESPQHRVHRALHAHVVASTGSSENVGIGVGRTAEGLPTRTASRGSMGWRPRDAVPPPTVCH